MIILFIVSGYYLSDDKYFNKIISENNLNSPIDAFKYINLNTPIQMILMLQNMKLRTLCSNTKHQNIF